MSKPQFEGYGSMGRAETSGAVNGVMRKFTDTSIGNPVIDNRNNAYFIELIVCDAIEPFSVQIAYEP